MSKKQKKNWFKQWQTDWYKDKVKTVFDAVDSYLENPPKVILDIGCGQAFESELFQKKYNSELYLLDGDKDTTNEKHRFNKYGPVNNFTFYNSIDALKRSYNERNLKYTFVDANDIVIEDSVKFDLIYSTFSCGYHYPADTYENLIKKHSTDDTVVIMDFQLTYDFSDADPFEIVNQINEGSGHKKMHIRFKETG